LESALATSIDASAAFGALVGAIQQQATPSWAYVAQGLAAFASVAAILVSLSSLAVSRRALAQTRSFALNDQLRVLGDEFEQRGYFVRFWFLDQLTRKRDNLSVDVDALPDHGEERYQTLWRAALGRDIELERADFFGLYHHSLRVAALGDSLDSAKEFAPTVNCLFGPHYLGTLLTHRLVACKLKGQKRDATYYLTNYGLTDKAYNELVDVLLNDLLVNDRSPSKRADYLSKWVAIDDHLRAQGIDPGTSVSRQIRVAVNQTDAG